MMIHNKNLYAHVITYFRIFSTSWNMLYKNSVLCASSIISERNTCLLYLPELGYERRDVQKLEGLKC